MNNLTNRNYTRQSHIIVNAKYALKKNEIDIILTLLTAITKEDKDFKDYQFTIKELAEKTNRQWNSKQLEETIMGLMSKPIKLPANNKRGFELVGWFSYFKYNDNGIITCRFDKALKPYLIEIVGTRILADFRHLLPMKSSYSKRMYLLLKEYNKIGKRTFNIEQLQEILKVPKSFKIYSEFKKKVLKKAEADINKFTDLEVKLLEKKLGRKVIEVTYTIKKNTNDLKSFIAMIREHYANVLLHYTKDKRPIKCSTKGFLYYADEEQSYIDKKEAQKLWEYLHENRENLYVIKKSAIELKKHAFLSSMEFFKEYLKTNFAHKKIIQLKQGDKAVDISIFPNGKLYDMSGESIDYDNIDKIWNILYISAKQGKLNIFDEEPK